MEEITYPCPNSDSGSVNLLLKGPHAVETIKSSSIEIRLDMLPSGLVYTSWTSPIACAFTVTVSSYFGDKPTHQMLIHH